MRYEGIRGQVNNGINDNLKPEIQANVFSRKGCSNNHIRTPEINKEKINCDEVVTSQKNVTPAPYQVRGRLQRESIPLRAGLFSQEMTFKGDN